MRLTRRAVEAVIHPSICFCAGTAAAISRFKRSQVRLDRRERGTELVGDEAQEVAHHLAAASA